MRNWWWFIDRLGNYEAHMHAIKRTIHHEVTDFQEVGIVESVKFGKILVLDGDMQSSQNDEFIYHESLVHPAMIAHENPESVLILGGGEGATLREVLKYKSVKKVVMIDIDGKLVEICKKYLPEWSNGAFEDPRVTVIHDDAIKWLETNSDKFDVIIADLTDPLPYTPSCGIYSIPFFESLKKTLSPNGIFATQSSRLSFLDMSLYCVMYSAVTKVFPMLRTATVWVPGFDLVWSFSFASENVDVKSLTPEEIDRRISERVEGELNFYEGAMHQSILALPKYLRQRLDDYLAGKLVPETQSQNSVYLI